jgi:hypothetical protein
MEAFYEDFSDQWRKVKRERLGEEVENKEEPVGGFGAE